LTDPSAEFFDGLERRGHEPRMEKIAGTVRFDLERDQRIEHWLLEVRHGELRMSREVVEADCVIHADRAVFDRMVTGQTKPLPAWLRNDVAVEGRLMYFLLLEKLIPGPPGARDPADAARDGSRAR
jgi:putative sterol carrier protein